MLAVTSMYQSDFLSVTRWFEMTEKTQKLPGCPFCGGTDITIHSPSSHGLTLYGVACDGCGARIKRFDEAEAITAWNRRAPQCGKE